MAKLNKTLIILFILLAVYILYYYCEYNETYETASKRTLDTDGIVIFHNPKYQEIVDYPSYELKKDALSYLPTDYVFIDYIYKISNSALFTFHRDVTSSKNIFKTKYPVYTLIVYNTDGCLISYCPGSHKSYPFVHSHIVNYTGTPGTVVLFDSDVLHAGCINKCTPRQVVQYKLCHKDDLIKLSSLDGIYKDKKEICNDTLKNRALRKSSYYFEFVINYIFTPFMMKKHDPNTFQGYLQSLVPITYYNNA